MTIQTKRDWNNNDLMPAIVIRVPEGPIVAALHEVLCRGMNTWDRQNEPVGNEIRALIKALE